MVDGWRPEKHLLGTMAPLEDPDKLRYMEIPMGESIWADRALTLMWHIVMRRAWSLSKHSAPPESLANLLSRDEAKRASAAEQLRSEHTHFLLLERAATQSDDADILRTAIIFLDADAVGVIFEFNARDRFDPSSRSGSWALRALLQSFPDNKLIEDVHQPLRLDARANVNRRKVVPAPHPRCCVGKPGSRV